MSTPAFAATLTVSSLADSGAGTLRDQVAAAPAVTDPEGSANVGMHNIDGNTNPE